MSSEEGGGGRIKREGGLVEIATGGVDKAYSYIILVYLMFVISEIETCYTKCLEEIRDGGRQREKKKGRANKFI